MWKRNLTKVFRKPYAAFRMVYKSTHIRSQSCVWLAPIGRYNYPTQYTYNMAAVTIVYLQNDITVNRSLFTGLQCNPMYKEWLDVLQKKLI